MPFAGCTAMHPANVYNAKTFNLNGVKFTRDRSSLLLICGDLRNSFQTAFSRKCKCVSAEDLHAYTAEAKRCL